MDRQLWNRLEGLEVKMGGDAQRICVYRDHVETEADAARKIDLWKAGKGNPDDVCLGTYQGRPCNVYQGGDLDVTVIHFVAPEAR